MTTLATLSTATRTDRTPGSNWLLLAAKTGLRVVGWPARVLRARRVMRDFEGMGERELRDIGLATYDIAFVRGLPLDHDPSGLLASRARDRSRRLARVRDEVYEQDGFNLR